MLAGGVARAAVRLVHATRATAWCGAQRGAQRALRHRSLPPDDPFGERSCASDPADGIYGAWGGVDFDAFASVATSETVGAVHFGPEWSRFTTVGRVCVQKMGECGSAALRCVAAQRGLTPDELHARELRQRKKLLERNCASYEDYVDKILGARDMGDCDVPAAVPCADRGCLCRPPSLPAATCSKKNYPCSFVSISVPCLFRVSGEFCRLNFDSPCCWCSGAVPVAVPVFCCLRDCVGESAVFTCLCVFVSFFASCCLWVPCARASQLLP
ncbi:hypothetical protein ERJ75_000329000 [Trypanosoma vivax]|nr:hypothetical protein ERJ75_000329000 [Trypanosoma vivax]